MISTNALGTLLFPNQSFLLSNNAPAAASAYNLANSTTTNLYTCPSGKKAMVCMLKLYNSHASLTGSVYPIFYDGSTNRRMRTAIAAGAGVSATIIVNFVLTAGQKFAVENVSSFSGSISAWATIIEFDDGTPLSTTYVTSLSSGANTIYTCPSGKVAFATSMSALLGQGSSTTPASLSYFNGSGSTLSFSMYSNQSGDSATETTNRLNSTTLSPASNASVIGQIPSIRTPGDFFAISNSSSASNNVLVYITNYEFPLGAI